MRVISNCTVCLWNHVFNIKWERNCISRALKYFFPFSDELSVHHWGRKEKESWDILSWKSGFNFWFCFGFVFLYIPRPLVGTALVGWVRALTTLFCVSLFGHVQRDCTNSIHTAYKHKAIIYWWARTQTSKFKS